MVQVHLSSPVECLDTQTRIGASSFLSLYFSRLSGIFFATYLQSSASVRRRVSGLHLLKALLLAFKRRLFCYIFTKRKSVLERGRIFVLYYSFFIIQYSSFIKSDFLNEE